MALTKDFIETVKARADRDPAYRVGLYVEAVQCMLDGDLATGRLLLRDFINVTMGFPELAKRMEMNEKSLMRMVSVTGNPTAEHLVALLQALKAECKLALTVSGKRTRKARAKVAVATPKDPARLRTERPAMAPAA